MQYLCAIRVLRLRIRTSTSQDIKVTFQVISQRMIIWVSLMLISPAKATQKTD